MMLTGAARRPWPTGMKVWNGDVVTSTGRHLGSPSKQLGGGRQQQRRSLRRRKHLSVPVLAWRFCRCKEGSA